MIATILCGLPMCGKTTIGRLLAKQLKLSFIDTDDLIEEAYRAKVGEKYACPQIFSVEGEVSFRALERLQIVSLKPVFPCIIAIGGGTLNDPINTKYLKEIGRFIYLKARTDILWERMLVHGIPKYLEIKNPQKAFEEVAEKRKIAYELAADITIDTQNLDQNAIVASILKRINGK